MPEKEQPVNAAPRVFADFINADRLGRVRLNTAGANEDIIQGRIKLSDGLRVELYDDSEIVTIGVVRHDPVEGWVAEVDWSAL